MSKKREVLHSLLVTAMEQKAKILNGIANIEFELTREAAVLDEEVADPMEFMDSVLNPPAVSQADEPSEQTFTGSVDGAPLEGDGNPAAETAPNGAETPVGEGEQQA